MVADDERGAAFLVPEPTQPAHEAARDDVVRGLDAWFTPAPDRDDAWRFRADVEEHGELGNGRVVVVAWRYEAEPREDVWGVAARRGPVRVDGVTFVDLEADDDARFARYVDWHQVFTQLGVAAAGHPVSE
jgi:hypothetical protein